MIFSDPDRDTRPPHYDDDTLEVYVLHNLEEGAAVGLRAHVGRCPQCAAALRATELYCEAMKTALRRLTAAKTQQ